MAVYGCWVHALALSGVPETFQGEIKVYISRMLSPQLT